MVQSAGQPKVIAANALARVNFTESTAKALTQLSYDGPGGSGPIFSKRKVKKMKNKDSDLVLIGFIDPGTSAVRRPTEEESEDYANECETCQGYGRVAYNDIGRVDSGTKWQRIHEYGVTDECPTCDGTGVER